jgi:hypothetical protein
MAYLVTLTVLVDEATEDLAETRVSHALKSIISACPIGAVVDWKSDSVARANESLNDAICNGTYETGDAFKDWTIFSRSEAIASGDAAGFWSNEFGWTTFDLATRFSAADRDLPMSAGDDALWMAAPAGLTYYQCLLVEFPGDSALDQTPIAFECWAENQDHAIEQAKNAYPNCNVLEAELI